MNSVVLVAPRGYSADFKAKIPAGYRVFEGAGHSTVIEDGTTRVYLSQNDSVRQELEREELGRILSTISDPIFYTIDYSDINLCKAVLLSIADDPQVLIDNDHGTLLPGPDFVRLLRSQQGWDWRRDLALIR